jgi:hypothetical protein
MRRSKSKTVRQHSVLEALENRQLFNILTVPQHFATVQAAVNASSPGDVIQVGYSAVNYTYTTLGQIYIGPGHNNLTIEGTDHPVGSPTATNDVIQAPGQATPDGSGNTTLNNTSGDANFVAGAEIEINGSTGIQITDLTIQGPPVLSTPGFGTNNLQYGVLVTGGGNVILSADTVQYMHDQDPNQLNNETGVGVAVAWGSATVSATNVYQFQKVGIEVGPASQAAFVAGHNQSATITGSTIDTQGFHSYDPSNDNGGGAPGRNINGQDGVEFLFGASGTLSNSIVNGVTDLGNADPGIGGGPGPYAGTDTAVLIYDAKLGGVSLTNGTIEASDFGLWIDGGAGLHGASKSTIVTGTTVTNNVYDGVDVVEGAKSISLKTMHINGNGQDGLFIDNTSTGDKIASCIFATNAAFDIDDQNLTAPQVTTLSTTGSVTSANTYTSDGTPTVSNA